MTQKTIDVLIVEDESRLAELHAEYIRRHFNFRAVGIATTLADARTMLQMLSPHLVLLDNYLPDGQGIELFENIIAHDHDCRVIFITAASDMDTCSKAIRFGAFDYIIKPVSYERLQHTLERFERLFNTQKRSQLLNQRRVDELFNLQTKDFSSNNRHAKGIEELTLQQVRDIFTHDDISCTAENVARMLGVSKTTARRYLEYGVEIRMLKVEISHGRVGRPERVYRKV